MTINKKQYVDQNSVISKNNMNCLLNKLNQEINYLKLPLDLCISTMTITCNVDTLIDIQNIGKYIDLSLDNIIGIKYPPDNIRSLVKLKKNNKKKNSKKSKNFY